MRNAASKVIMIPAGWLGNTLDTLDEDTLRRLTRGLALWKQDRTQTILVTGGCFRSAQVQSEPASCLMADWLIEQGVPEIGIIRETRALDTYQNVSGSCDALARAGIDVRRASILVVSQFQHVLRFWLTFLLGHGKWVRLEPLWYANSPKSFCVEWAFILYHLLDWRGTLSPARYNRDERAKRLA